MLAPPFTRFLHLASVLLVGIITLVLALFFYWSFFGWPDPFWLSLAPTVALGATVTGMIGWLLGMWRSDYVTDSYSTVLFRGILIGVISNFAAYPLIGVLAYLQAVFNHAPVHFPHDFVAYLIISFVFAMIIGMATAFMSVVIGAGVAAGTKCITCWFSQHLENKSCCLRKCLLVQAFLFT